MSKAFAKSFYASTAWRDCRASYIKKVFGLCEKCREPGHIVHHIIPITPSNIDDPYVTLAHKNLMYLCLEHHNQIHGNSNPLREDVMFDEFGQLIKR